ncbi:MAG: YggS family pyridoxal phosphate-dependent enzyme [Prevotellaceae bacterium]|nr:YggS family pyridoxal phosphate-dependent enzyme [Prevotellaceae bacterium]MDD7108073.1 YggS family pyridoxal phosphate-dependent enzyme [Prevotellaceae bacterium]MDY3295941.1 YggS family pyridoxal phosphate-dependent enzyme [Bacteroidaceae bacterium]
MSAIQNHLQNITNELPQGVTLVAVSKYHPASDILEAYHAGQRVFGENLAREMQNKHDILPKDIQWHFIGHLQKNKVKYIAPFVSMIQSVDSIQLLQEIDRQAAKHNRIIPCLLQIHVAQEQTKFGLTFQECLDLLEEGSWRQLTHIRIDGIMGIATHTEDTSLIRKEFQSLNNLFKQVKETYFLNDDNFSYKSWGMSDDYQLALQENSNTIRIGSAIFGNRPSKESLQ